MTVIIEPEVLTTQIEPEPEQRTFLFKPNQEIWLLLSIFEALLALRFVLKLIKAKPTTPLAGIIYVFSGLMRLRIFQF